MPSSKNDNDAIKAAIQKVNDAQIKINALITAAEEAKRAIADARRFCDNNSMIIKFSQWPSYKGSPAWNLKNAEDVLAATFRPLEATQSCIAKTKHVLNKKIGADDLNDISTKVGVETPKAKL